MEDAMQVVQKKIRELREAEYNPRKLSRKQRAELKKSLEGFGVVEPAVVNMHPERLSVIIGGHQRIRIAKELGYEEFPCIEVNLTPERERELNIRLNRNLGQWSQELLAEHFDPDELLNWGFDERELDFRKLTESLNEDDVPEPPEEVRTKPGDLYELGDHRLLCGDTTMQENVDRLMEGKKAKLIFTSPPYNLNAGLYAGYKDNRDNADYIMFNIHVLLNWKRILSPKGFVFWNMSYGKKSGASFIEVFYHFVKHTGLVFLEDIVWDKGHGMPLSEQLTRQYEHLLVLNESAENIHFIDHIGVFGVKKIPFIAGKKRGITNYWRLDTFRSQSEKLKAAFPVELPAKAIEITTDEGDGVADCFGGSGTTMIAAQRTGRKCFLMELDPVNCDITVERYLSYTGERRVRLNGEEIEWPLRA
jgi:DNA modification methylase